MDESLSQAMNFMNEKQSSESSSVLEALPWEKKAEMSDRSDGLITFAFGNMEKYNDSSEVQVLSSTSPFQETTTLVKKDYSVPFSKMHRPFIRRKNTQEDIAFNRECKKLELVWTNRDLPVDRRSLCSAANKDAFDLRDLSESLPSSTSEKKIRAMKMICQQRPTSYSSQLQQKEKFEASMKVSPFSSKTERLHLSDRSPESESMASVQSRLSLLRAQKWCRFRRIYCQLLAELEKEPASIKQNETSNENKNLNIRKSVQDWESLDLEFNEMSDGKQKQEKQDSGVQNNQKSIEITPMPKLNQDMGQCSSWDSEKKWITDFQFRDVCVPLNSPNKGNANKDDPFLSMQKILETTRQCCVRLMRAQRTLKALNSLRGDVSESMDESESEMPSAKQASGASTLNQLNFREEADNL